MVSGDSTLPRYVEGSLQVPSRGGKRRLEMWTQLSSHLMCATCQLTRFCTELCDSYGNECVPAPRRTISEGGHQFLCAQAFSSPASSACIVSDLLTTKGSEC